MLVFAAFPSDFRQSAPHDSQKLEFSFRELPHTEQNIFQSCNTNMQIICKFEGKAPILQSLQQEITTYRVKTTKLVIKS